MSSRWGETEVVTVTEEAAREMRAKLLTATSDPEVGLRLLPGADGRYVLVLDTELSGDQVVVYQGSKVLLVGIEYYRTLEGTTIDCGDTEEGAVLFVR